MKPDSKLKAKIANWQYATTSYMKQINKRWTAKILRAVAKRDADNRLIERATEIDESDPEDYDLMCDECGGKGFQVKLIERSLNPNRHVFDHTECCECKGTGCFNLGDDI